MNFIDITKGKQIALIGQTDDTDQLIRDYGDRLSVSCLYVTEGGNGDYEIDGTVICPIENVHDVLPSKDYFYILCTKDFFDRDEMMPYYGMTYGRDYVDVDLFRCALSGKKIAVFFGICYVRAIMDCLKESKAFTYQYEVWDWMSYKPMTAFEHSFFLYMISVCDLYVYNDCISYREKMKNKAYVSKTKPSCVRISIPIIEFRGYHPQTLESRGKDNLYCVTSRRTSYSPFLSPDCNVNCLIDENIPADEIVKKLSDNSYYSKNYLQENIEKQWRTVELYEEYSDIKICDFLKRNHCRERLFFNERHMTNPVIIELAKRVLLFMGIIVDIREEELLKRRLLNTTEVPVYPSVIYQLGLTVYGDSPKYKLFSFQKPTQVTFEEYIRLYVDFCSHMKKYMDRGFFPRESMGWNVQGGDD